MGDGGAKAILPVVGPLLCGDGAAIGSCWDGSGSSWAGSACREWEVAASP